MYTMYKILTSALTVRVCNHLRVGTYLLPRNLTS